LRIGLPTAGENISYNLSQIVISRFIAGLGTSALATYSLVLTLSRYVFISGVSIGSGTQVKVGYLVGADRAHDAYRRVYKYFFVGLSISAVMVVLLNLFKDPILHLFTSNPEIIALASSVFLVSLVLEPCRNFNTIFIPGLKGAGDIRFPVFLGMTLTWILGVGGAYLLGLVMGWGLVGIWIAMTADEGLRGIVMMLRWRSGRWKSKGLVARP
jgi:Na+-driven multidrug efflux pump